MKKKRRGKNLVIEFVTYCFKEKLEDCELEGGQNVEGQLVGIGVRRRGSLVDQVGRRECPEDPGLQLMNQRADGGVTRLEKDC